MRRLLVLTGALVLLPLTAWATPCETDQDCSAEEYCVSVPSTCPPCEPGAECGSCDQAGGGECVPQDSGGSGEFWSGVKCSTDADCPDFFACKEETVPCAMPAIACDCPPCESGAECPECSCPDQPADCTEESMKICVYEAKDCNADADCGEGFECYADEICTGSVSGGCACPGCAPGEECAPCNCDETPSEPVEDQCEVVGSYCAPKLVECAADADCPGGWECAMVSSGTTNSGTACACAPCACAEGESCACEPCECDGGEATDPVEESTSGYCLPGGWGDAIASVAGEYDSTSEAGGAPGGGSGGGAGGGASGPSKGGLEDLLGAGAQNFDNGGGASPDPQAPGDPNGGDPAGTAGTGAGTGSGSSAGCSATTTAATGFAAIFGILLVVFALLTRRAVAREE